MTTLSTAEVCKLTATIVGGEYKRAASKDEAVKRFSKVATEAKIDAKAILAATDFRAAATLIDAARAPKTPLVEAAKKRSAALDLLEAEAKAAEKAKPIREKKVRAPKEDGHTPRTGSKQAAMIEMLRKPEGTTIPEIMAATGWQAHTVRGAFAGALKKKLGLEVTSEKIEGRGRVYRIA